MKNNLFIRLYFLIVMSIITIGIGINWIWQNDDFQNAINTSLNIESKFKNPNIKQYELLTDTIAFQLNSNYNFQSNVDINNYLQNLGDSLNLIISLIDKDAIPQDAFQENRTLVLKNTNDQLASTTTYTYISELSKILKITLPKSIYREESNERNRSETIFLILFYGLIALVVFYWIWPLSKDLSLLQKALKNFDADNWGPKLDFPSASPIAHLARSYNQLLDKIKRMIENEKSMANSISHELRTPLARIRFSLQMAKESKDSHFIIQQINSIEEDIEEMNQLITEILSYASIDNQAFKTQLSRGDLGSLLELLVARLEKNFPNHQIKFLSEGDTQSVLCDSILIERAIQNLIVNACKYGKGNIELFLKENKKGYQISVSNDGDMIIKKQLKNIFDAYYQIPTDEKRTGFGLGLSLVKRIADLHKGIIVVQQSKLGGAEFILKWRKNIQ